MTSTNTLGIRNGNQIIPYSGALRRTKQYDLTISAANFTPSRAVAIAYADSAGIWRLSFNLQGSVTGTPTAITIAVTGVVFKSGFYQACAIGVSDSGTYRAWDAFTSSNTGNILCNTVSGGVDFVLVSGDVELNAEPTWAAANMEGAVNASVYIPAASAGVVGLVNNAVANTAGTPILGKTDGVAVAAGYVGEQRTLVFNTISAITANPVASSNGISLPAGTWLIYGRCNLNGTASSTGASFAISTNNTSDGSGYINDLLTAYDPAFGGGWPIATTLYTTAGATLYAKALSYGANRPAQITAYAVRIA